jgi:hypothetical protein
MDRMRVTAARADVYIVSAFQRLVATESSSLLTSSAQVLELLYSIFTLATLVRALPELFESGYVTPTQSRLLRRALDDALTAMLDVAVALKLTDAFAFTGFEMDGSVPDGDDGGGDVMEGCGRR